MKVGIIGYGWVGKATHKLYPDAQIYDKFMPEYKQPLSGCDIAFIAVPTPWDGKRLDCDAVEDAISVCDVDLIVVRSAVYPGFCDEMSDRYNKNVCYQPEYLGETPNHPMLEMKGRQFMVLGGKPENRRKIIECYTRVYNADVSIRQVTNYEAELIKITENRAVFWKVMQCQELYDACEAAGVDYYTIRDSVYGDDPRQNFWFSFIYPEKRGCDSKCIPKDIYAWAAWAEGCGFESTATKALLDYNLTLIGKESYKNV